MSKHMSSQNEAGVAGARKKRAVGHAALSLEEKQILSWSREQRLAEFEKVNSNVDKKNVENRLLFIDSMAIDNGEIRDVLRVNPKVTWEIVRDMFTGDAVDGYTSTFHGLDDINYPKHFWKATIENERQKLIRDG
jgi:hypothetical protein